MPSLASRRFMFVTGKGGVGKTSVTAALALRLSEQGRRVLLAMGGPKEHFSKLFGVAPLTPAITRVRENLSAVLLVPEAALHEYGMLVLKSRKLVESIFDNRYVHGFLNGAPGLREWAMLGKAWYHSTEMGSDGRARFDTVLFDAPATGHSLGMLRVPKVIVEIAPPGVLRRDAERAWQMFRDPAESGVVLVTLPEEMPTNETLELHAALRDELGLPIALLVVNGMLPGLFSAEERHKLASLAEFSIDQVGDAAILAGRRRALREALQQANLERLRGLGLPLLELPQLRPGVTDARAVSELSRFF